MKHKMDMAHEMALEIMKLRPELMVWQIADRAWEYADAMQAEADKREDKTRPEVLATEESPKLDIDGLLHSIDEYFDQAECTKTHRMANNLLAEVYEKLSGEVNSPEEWQPDWSQAPDDAIAWEHLGHGAARWHTTTKGMYKSADLFGYSGTDMLLVERPQ